MRVYIASKYYEYDINREIFNRLAQNSISSFLPETINKFETSIGTAAHSRGTSPPSSGSHRPALRRP